MPGQELEMYTTSHDTYTTAGVAFGTNGEMAFGNDAGVLMVVLDSSESEDSSFQVEPGHLVIVALIVACLLYTSPSPRDAHESRMPSSA